MHGMKKGKKEDFRRQFQDPVERRLNKQYRQNQLSRLEKMREEELYENFDEFQMS